MKLRPVPQCGTSWWIACFLEPWLLTVPNLWILLITVSGATLSDTANKEERKGYKETN